MLKNIRNKKAQNTAEYAILIALVIGGVVAMQTYAQRALQARVRDTSIYMTNAAGNQLGTHYQTGQYEPYYSNSVEESDKSDTSTQSKSGTTLTTNTAVLTNKGVQKDRTTYTGPAGQ